MKYVRLQFEDQYGVRYYTRAGKAVQFEDEQKVRVRWPDGKESTETLYLKTHTEMVSEQGHPRRPVENTLPHIRSSLNGLEVKVDDLSKLEIAVEDIKSPVQRKRKK